jgi:tetratricopeptide (TPR) repeat protein
VSFEPALMALSHLPETRNTLELAIDLRFDLRNSLHTLAEFGRIEGYLREAEALAKTLNDQRRLGWVSAYMSGHHIHTGGPVADVRACAQRIEAIGATLRDEPLQVAAQYYLLFACHLAGDYRGSEHICRRLIESLQGERTRERFGLALFPAVLSRAYLAHALAEQGRFGEGDGYGHEAIRIAEAVDHPFSLMWACLELAYLNTIRGELGQASPLLERALAISRDWSMTTYIPATTAALGHVYAWSGRIGEGISMLQEALTAYEAAGVGYNLSTSIVQLGEAYLLAHRVKDASACGVRAVTLARERGERGHEAWALHLLGETASHQDSRDVAAAESHYSAATALASELGMPPLVAHCHFGLGRLYRRANKRIEAQDQLATAATMYREMNMRFWLEKVEEEVRQREPA